MVELPRIQDWTLEPVSRSFEDRISRAYKQRTGDNGITTQIMQRVLRNFPVGQRMADGIQIAVYVYCPKIFETSCQGCAEREQSDPEWSGVTPEWKRVDNKGGGITLASARALCLDLLSRVWLRISGGLNCCQESRRGVV